VDFAHTLSYNGMPAFLSPNSVSKAAMYWIAGRLIHGIGIMAALVMTNSRRRWLSPGYLAAGSVAVVFGLMAVVSYFPEALPAMYVQGSGLTPLKITLEWVVIGLYALSIYVFGRRGQRETNVVLLQMALVVGIFSELGFTLYSSAYDTYNLLGHIYKVMAYFLIFKALFVSSLQRPYYELVKARYELEKSFSRIGDALASSLDLKQALQLIAELGSNMLGAKSATVMLLRDGKLNIEAGTGMMRSDRLVSTSHTAAGLAISSRRPVLIPDVTTISDHDPNCHCQNLIGPPARSVVSAPILSGSEVFGVVEVYSPNENAFGRKQADLLASFAGQAAVAIRNSITFEREHQIAESLQRTLLPDPPTIPGMDIAVKYLPAEDEARVGGDLYDVFPLEDGRLAVVIGDVSGHGLEAASMMAMTAYTLRGLLLHGMDPGEAFGLTNRTLARRSSEELRFATVFGAVIDTENRTMKYANAGHLMPVMLQEGACASMEQQSELPMGILESTQYPTHEADLSSVTGILLYTDGLIEVRRQGEMLGERRLISACSELLTLSSADMIRGIIERSRKWTGGILHDDIACLAVKWENRSE